MHSGIFMKNNKGYSLVEIIIVVAILSVLTAGISMSASAINNSNAKACANSIRDALAEAKILAMSKGSNSTRLNLYKDADGNLYAKQEISSGSSGWNTYGNEERIGKRKVEIYYVLPGEDERPLNNSESICLSFDRASGSFKDQIEVNGAIKPIPEKIIVRGGSRTINLVIHELTGKVDVQ